MAAISWGVISEHAVRAGDVAPGALWAIAAAGPACASIVAMSMIALIATDIAVLLTKWAFRQRKV